MGLEEGAENKKAVTNITAFPFISSVTDDFSSAPGGSKLHFLRFRATFSLQAKFFFA